MTKAKTAPLFPPAKVWCAHEDCELPSMCRVETKTGWANLCRPHYDQHFQIQADVANAGKGLTTGDQMRAFCKNNLGIIKPAGRLWAREVIARVNRKEPVSITAYELAKSAVLSTRSREPGEDIEEMEVMA